MTRIPILDLALMDHDLYFDLRNLVSKGLVELKWGESKIKDQGKYICKEAFSSKSTFALTVGAARS